MRALWPLASLLTGGLVRTRGPKTGSTIYLTFDDGPHPVHTPELLSVLDRHGAKATFYMIGKAAEENPELVRRIQAGGHAIGNHSMGHPKMRTVDRLRQWREIDQADAVLAAFDGRARHPFRPPNGHVTFWALVACLLNRERLALWSVDSLDYKLDAAKVVDRLRAMRVTDGDVILFHDDAHRATEALETLLPHWAAAGLRFSALP